MDLVLHEHERDGVVVLTVAGELDLATAPRLRDRLTRLATQGPSAVVVDLSGVVLMDSVGLGVLIGGMCRVESLGARFAVVCPPGRPRDLLVRCRLDRVLSLVDDEPAALAEVGGGHGRA